MSPYSMENQWAIVDIDGVVADCTHRLRFIKQEPPDWNGFFEAATDDAPITQMIKFVRELSHSGTDIFFVTGRPERIRDITVDWLQDLRLPATRLYMRKDGDHREDHVVKKEIYEELRKAVHFDPIAIFEDRDQVVKMWRDIGLLCLQPKKGDY